MVTITDVCPECETDHIDMQALTFNKVHMRALHSFFPILLSDCHEVSCRQSWIPTITE